MSIIHRSLKKIDRQAAENPPSLAMSRQAARGGPPPQADGRRRGQINVRVVVLLIAIVITGLLAWFIRGDAFTELMIKIGVVKTPKYELAPGIGDTPEKLGVPMPKNLQDVQPERGETPGAGGSQAFHADPVQVKVAGMYNDEGKALFAKADYEGARDKFLEALKRDPTSGEYNSNVGLTLKMLGRLSDAQTHYKRAIEIDPGCVECMNNLAVVWMQMGQSEQAKALFNQAIAANSRYADAHLNLAIMLEREGNWQEAGRHYAQYKDLAENLDPEILKGLNRRIRLGG
ncbi:MAG: tetratricopeptide repeat protein [Nitrospirae bacterium]|nr:tetratricopeptide repeat protein [Nitrospirota bacterium]